MFDYVNVWELHALHVSMFIVHLLINVYILLLKTHIQILFYLSFIPFYLLVLQFSIRYGRNSCFALENLYNISRITS